ncbi:hypothetical protein HYH03_014508 [Edaphochlamys debaryana]|uniref:Flavin-containing monooxygenase n=1 Tax=Edaphochlamys debaryana TaxID=47281 RepID=A0A835XNP3_9CHLO|nr:hypothetical protein HYH03_014508 [Edaphochlamys debaryana]|eukprot:KAG2486825.1 hypothetical protein HYH03_014508 [Edaphochlamys debaryana]
MVTAEATLGDRPSAEDGPVLVVGAGVAGLQAARAFLRRGTSVVVLEQSEDVGGVWIRNYQGYGLQVPFEMYQFPEFPIPRKAELSEYPSGEAVREYVQSYARHFGLYRHILFSCRLVTLRRKPPPPGPAAPPIPTACGGGGAATAAAAAAGDSGAAAAAGRVLDHTGTASGLSAVNPASAAPSGVAAAQGSPVAAGCGVPANRGHSTGDRVMRSANRLRELLSMGSRGSRGTPTATGTGNARYGAAAAAVEDEGSSTVEIARTLGASVGGGGAGAASWKADGGTDLASGGGGDFGEAGGGGGGGISGDGLAEGLASAGCSGEASSAPASLVGSAPCQGSRQGTPRKLAPSGSPPPPSGAEAGWLPGPANSRDAGAAAAAPPPPAPPAAQPGPGCRRDAAGEGPAGGDGAKGKGQGGKGRGGAPPPQPGGEVFGQGWTAVYEEMCTGRQFTLDASYVILATGLHATPFIPSIPGQELYRGLQVHSRDFTDAGVAAGKRVLVVGAGKTAADIVTELTATSKATAVTLLYRRPHWPLPRRVGPVSITSLAHTRLASTALLPAFYDAGPGARAAAALLTPVRKAFWARFMSRVNRALRVRKTLGRPDRPIFQDIWYSGQVLDAAKWPDIIHNPKVAVVQGEVDRFTPVSAVLRDGTELHPDIVLYATGYSNQYTFLEPDVREALHVEHDGVYLYRHMMAPGLPGLAFVGAEVSTFNNILTSALQAEWLAAALAGAVHLPVPEAMAADVASQKAWRRRTMPPHKLRGSSVMLYMQCYHDQLLRDMGLHTHRKHASFARPLAECLQPYTAADYGDLYEQLYSHTAAKAAAAVAAASAATGVRNGGLTPADVTTPAEAAAAARLQGQTSSYGATAAAAAAAAMCDAAADDGWRGTATTTAVTAAIGGGALATASCSAGGASAAVTWQQPSAGGANGSSRATWVLSQRPSAATLGAAGFSSSAGPSGGPSSSGYMTKGAVPGSSPAMPKSPAALLAAAAGPSSWGDSSCLLVCSPAAAAAVTAPASASGPVPSQPPPSPLPMPFATPSQGQTCPPPRFLAVPPPLAEAVQAPHVSQPQHSPQQHVVPRRRRGDAVDELSYGMPEHGEYDEYNEQDTLYSLDALPPAMQAYRRTHVPSYSTLQADVDRAEDLNGRSTTACAVRQSTANGISSSQPSASWARTLESTNSTAAAAAAAASASAGVNSGPTAVTNRCTRKGGAASNRHSLDAAWHKHAGMAAAGGGASQDADLSFSAAWAGMTQPGGGGIGGGGAAGASAAGVSGEYLIMGRSGSSAVTSGTRAADSPGRRLRQVVSSFAAGLRSRRKDVAQNDVTSSRMEASSPAVGQLSYRLLPPKHVEEAMAAQAAAAAGRDIGGGGRPAAAPSAAMQPRLRGGAAAAAAAVAPAGPEEKAAAAARLKTLPPPLKTSREATKLAPPPPSAVRPSGSPCRTVPQQLLTGSCLAGGSITDLFVGDLMLPVPPSPAVHQALCGATAAAACESTAAHVPVAASAITPGGNRVTHGTYGNPPGRTTSVASSSGVSYTPSCSTIVPPPGIGMVWSYCGAGSASSPALSSVVSTPPPPQHLTVTSPAPHPPPPLPAPPPQEQHSHRPQAHHQHSSPCDPETQGAVPLHAVQQHQHQSHYIHHQQQQPGQWRAGAHAGGGIDNDGSDQDPASAVLPLKASGSAATSSSGVRYVPSCRTRAP